MNKPTPPEDRDLSPGNLLPFFVIVLILIIIAFIIPCKVKSQIFITPSAQVSLYDQSVGVMAGFKLSKITLAFNYQRGHQYKEQSLFFKYDFTNNHVFNVGLSLRTGFVNSYFKLFYPALEQEYVFNQKWSAQLGLRPTEHGLLILEPRIQFKF